MKAYWIGGDIGCEGAEVDRSWWRDCWPELACPKCQTLKPLAVPFPIDVVLHESTDCECLGPLSFLHRPEGLGMPLLGTIEVIDVLLADELGLESRGFALGSVSCGGRVVNSHWTVVEPASLRIPGYSDSPVAWYSRCDTCGRRFEHIPWGQTWYRDADVRGLDVFGGCGGGLSFVSERLWRSKDLRSWPRLSCREVALQADGRPTGETEPCAGL
jgi:hypothetical protein